MDYDPDPIRIARISIIHFPEVWLRPRTTSSYFRDDPDDNHYFLRSFEVSDLLFSCVFPAPSSVKSSYDIF